MALAGYRWMETEYALSAGTRAGQQTLVFLFDDSVTLASTLLEPGSIKYRNSPARVANQTGGLQEGCSMGYTSSTNPQHAGYEFLGHHQLVTFKTIKTQ